MSPYRKSLFILLSLLILAVLAGCGGSPSSLNDGGSPAAAAPVLDSGSLTGPGVQRVLIGFRSTPGKDDEDKVARSGGRIKETFQLVPVIAASLPAQAIQALRSDPRVAYVEPDAIAHATADTVPWGVVRVQAPTVWQGGNLGSGVRIAVIDTGIDYRHPDLAKVYRGGYDFANRDTDPLDDEGHGTHVAGTIAAAANGSLVKGVSPYAGLYALKVLAADGSGTYSSIISALQWAVKRNVPIVSMSLGGDVASASLQKACDAAYAHGILLVAAAGNSGQATSASSVIYPAAYSSVIAVAATDSQNKLAYFSSTGPAIELAAPGVNINSDRLGGGTMVLSGTSMACPHVTGVAALVIRSGVTGAAAVRQKLDSTATDLGATGRDTSYGYGLVNAAKAVAP